MAGRLLLLVLMYSFSEMKAQALLPPKLSVNPSMITETDSVTLNCQPPSSVPVSQCYFHFVRGEPAKTFSCLKTLTGTELLQMSHQSSPAEVKVTCVYLHYTQSPESDTSSIIIRTSRPPKLTVNPPVINATDSVTLNCQTPSSVSVSQCFFFTLSGGTISDSCLQTLTGTELLKNSHQSSPAEVKVTCFYTVKFGNTDSPSPHSDTSSITIHIQKPKLTLQHFHHDHVLFTCSLPGSANHDTRCNLYFGEDSDPVVKTNVRRKTTTNQWICQFSVTTDDLLSRLRSVQQHDASCDYSLGSEPNSLSPRSDRSSLTDIVETELSKTQTTPTFAVTRPQASTPVTTAKQTSGRPATTQSPSVTPLKPASETDKSTNPVTPKSVMATDCQDQSFGTPETKNGTTPLKTTSEMWIWKFAAVAAGCGVTVGAILLVSALLCKKRRTVGSEEVKNQEGQNENFETYHLYSTIPEEPDAPAPKRMVYSTVQTH